MALASADIKFQVSRLKKKIPDTLCIDLKTSNKFFSLSLRSEKSIQILKGLAPFLFFIPFSPRKEWGKGVSVARKFRVSSSHSDMREKKMGRMGENAMHFPIFHRTNEKLFTRFPQKDKGKIQKNNGSLGGPFLTV